ncbi:type II toxin-antitoxin system HicA family toxin [Pseudohongiella sp. SYSU M77423]|uniref:type II toxin-antitoxin system HicA family toxin n=1 Tax=Pseudohongiella sp. SYSU M77423 TaxID=3042312 RepID=UPI0039833533
MTAGSKALEKIKANPGRVVTWTELCAIMKHLGYEIKQRSGSRTAFFHPKTKRIHMFHKPHPGDELVVGARLEFINILQDLREL